MSNPLASAEARQAAERIDHVHVFDMDADCKCGLKMTDAMTKVATMANCESRGSSKEMSDYDRLMDSFKGMVIRAELAEKERDELKDGIALLSGEAGVLRDAKAALAESYADLVRRNEELTAKVLNLIVRADAAESLSRELVEALQLVAKEWLHEAPQHCYSTGPSTGNIIQDYVACPGCAVQRKVEAAINSATPLAAPEITKKCSSCGDATDYCCADCMIERREKVYVCGKIECREAHEANRICQEKI